MHRLPYDVQLAIVRLLSVQDVIRFCATCKASQEFMRDRTIWHHMLSRLLLHFPNPQLSLRLVSMEVEEMKRWVLHSAKLDRMWHKIDYHPRLIRDLHCDKRVEHVNLVAGGDWLVIVLRDGSLQLHELGATAPAATLSQPLTQDESVLYLSSRLSLTHEREDLIILQMGVRYNQCNIYVYHIAVVDPVPTFLRVGKISVTGSVWSCASGLHVLVYGLESGEGDMILHVYPLGRQYADVEGPAVSMNIGPWSADEDFTISVLSDNQIILAYQGVWSTTADIGSGIYRISPFAHNANARTHPLVIAGTRALHVLRVFPDSRVDYREVPYPLALGAEVGYMGLGAVGVRRAIWDCTEARNGSLHVHFRTGTSTSSRRESWAPGASSARSASGSIPRSTW
ncbi:hypothetical protein BD309DRAFT_871086 [Dichomitus squalens]|uniref:Uncharacterized protein n=1 Tax=Dichomitus squalens TaxID=114155 RepID=A0A4V2K6X9_9APHY|nr:hypothetical protein BD309DRAFT_871086 [Dichomitus squalens]TBU53958.1 hypothetical protein BD310DRAFT_951767 [Dichomitus squalens]